MPTEKCGINLFCTILNDIDNSIDIEQTMVSKNLRGRNDKGKAVVTSK